MGERPPVWRVAVNILNKQSQTADKGQSSSWGLGEVLITPHHKSVLCYDPLTKASDLDIYITCCQPHKTAKYL